MDKTSAFFPLCASVWCSPAQRQNFILSLSAQSIWHVMMGNGLRQNHKVSILQTYEYLLTSHSPTTYTPAAHILYRIRHVCTYIWAFYINEYALHTPQACPIYLLAAPQTAPQIGPWACCVCNGVVMGHIAVRGKILPEALWGAAGRAAHGQMGGSRGHGAAAVQGLPWELAGTRGS